jgi:hypothetical protein
MTELDDVYADDQPKPEVQAEVIPEQVVTGEESATPAPEPEQAQPEVDWRAEAEKAKRTAEEAERKARGLEQAIAAVRQKQREQPQANFAENPAEYVEKVRAEMAQQVQLVRIEAMQAAARSRFTDYDEKEAVFAQLAETNPYLVAQLKQAQDPAEFAYKTAQFHMEMQAAGGSIEALKAKLAAELKAERAEKFAKQTANLPKTLAGASGTGRSASAAFAGPTSLSDLYAKPKR